MIAQFPFTADLIQAFGWALLHSFWQAFLIFACLRLVLLLIPQASSNIKYNLSYISLTGIFVWFSVTLWQQLQAIRTIHLAAAAMINTGVRYTHVELPAIYHSQSTLTSLFPYLEVFFPPFVAIYVAGVAIMTIKLVMDLLQLQQIRKTQVLPADAVWEQHLAKLTEQLQIPRKVKLLISSHIQVPVMIGFLKPLILLPVIMFNNLTAEQLEAILVHELAHIKRNDYILNIFQSIVETILFFNPFIWWISKNIRLEREHCCDDLVLAGQVQPLHYAKALVALEEYRLTVNALAMAAADNKQHLFHRIKRIMEMKTKNINYSQKMLAALIIAAGLVSVAWLNPPAANAKIAVKNNVNNIAGAPAITSVSYRLQNDTVPERAEAKQPTITRSTSVSTYISDDKNETDMQQAKLAMVTAQQAMQNINWDQINTDISKAMQNIDWDKINKDVQKSMDNIDWKKMNAEIRKGMEAAKTNIKDKDINEAVQKGLAAAQTSLNSEAIKESIRQAMEGAKAAAVNAHVQANVNVQVQDAVKHAQESVDLAMQSAQAGQQAAIQQMKMVKVQTGVNVNNNSYSEMIKKMAGDKLIDTEKGYKIEKKSNGDFYINDVKQSDAVVKQYSDYLNNVKTLAITGKTDNMMVSVEQ